MRTIILLFLIGTLSSCLAPQAPNKKKNTTTSGGDTPTEISRIDNGDDSELLQACVPGTATQVDCVEQIGNAHTASFSRTCNADGMGYSEGACFVNSCLSGYQVENNSCVVEPICVAGTSTQVDCTSSILNAQAASYQHTCNLDGMSYTDGICTVSSCNQGYEIQENSCNLIVVETPPSPPRPQDCGDILNGQTITRVRYQSATVPNGSSCISETQSSTCDNGVMSVYTGSYLFDSCSIEAPVTSTRDEITGDYSYFIETTHPRIFLTTGHIETLKARIGTDNFPFAEYGTHSEEYALVKETADNYSASQIASYDGMNMARMALANAFVYMMEGGNEYLTKAKVILDGISGFGADDKSHYGFYASCIIYDWLYNDLTVNERTQYSNDIVNYVTNASAYSTYNSFDPYYHDRKYPSSLFALSGQAIYNERPTEAIEFINRSFAVYERMMIAQNEISSGGFIYPIGGPAYFDESGWQPIFRVLGGLKFAGLSGPSIDAIDFTAISNTAYGEIYALVKDNFLISHNDGYNQRNGDQKPWRYARGPEGALYSAMLAKLHEGEEIGKITNYLQSNYTTIYRSEYPFVYIGNILFNNKIINTIGSTITDLPLTRQFDDSVLTYREGWSGLKSDGSEVIFNFMGEKHVNGHTSFAKGHFDIWRGYDPLTFRAGDYSNTSYTHYIYYRSSLSSNVMLIRNPAEDTGSLANDGQQLSNVGEGGNAGKHGSSEWSQIGHASEGGVSYGGRIKGHSHGDNFFYSYLHYPTAYSPSKVDDISRTVARIGGYYFVLDRVDGVDANFSKKWMMHTIGQPVIEDSGSWNGGTALDSNGGTPLQISSNAKLLSFSEGNSKLFVKSIFPQNTIVNRVGGSADYRWYSYNEGVNYDQGAPEHTGYGNWRIEIESNMNSVNDLFLTVLHPTGSSGQMANTTQLSGSNYLGVAINGNVSTDVAIFSNSVDESTKQSAYSFNVASNNPVKVLIGDLISNNYYVYRNGSLVGTFFVSVEQKSLYFEVSGGGDFIVSSSPVVANPK